MVTYGVPYMGSKNKIIPSILEVTKKVNPKTVLDLFTGTTRVAQSFRQTGYTTYANDLSFASSCYGALFLELNDLEVLIPYLEEMNKLDGYEGWFTKNYHGDQTNELRGNGRYMQYHNTIKVDAARDYVDTLNIDNTVKKALIACILLALPGVDNTLGQQQAYLKEWCSRSFKKIEFKIPGRISGPSGKVFNLDCTDNKLSELQPDLVYIDPPYSKNVWYPSYYHIYDSVALWDKPETVGKSKRRIDRSSVGKKIGIEDSFIYDNNMWYTDDQREAFSKVLDNFKHSNFLISYSSDSNLNFSTITDLLSGYGTVNVYTLEHKTNILGLLGGSTEGKKVYTPKNNVSEYLFLIQKDF